MDDFDVDIPDVRPENNFTVIYKGRESIEGNFVEKIEEIKTSKDDFFRKLRYFKRKSYEFNHLNEIYIHDIYPIEIFKKFIGALKTNKIRLNDSNYSDLHKLSLKYEYQELQQQIEYFSQNRPDIKQIVDTYSFDEIDSLKEEKIAAHLDICLQNEHMVNFPIPLLNRILNSPKRKITDHHLLYQFIKNVIKKHTIEATNNNNENNDNEDDFQVLLSSLDYCQMSNDDLDELLNDRHFSGIFNGQNSKNRMKSFIEESKLNQKRLNDLELQMKSFKTDILSEIQNFSQKSQDSENKIGELESKIAQQAQIISQNRSENQNLRNLVEAQKLKIIDLENKVNELEIKTACYINGKITASVKSDQSIHAVINLVEENATLDTTKSKYILNTKSSPSLTVDEYQSGSAIDSLNKEIICNVKAGTYFVHALIVDNHNQSKQLVSGPLVTQGIRPLTFGFTGNVQSVTLEPGSYKLEVWGAEGGKYSNRTNTPGKGGYSVGVLSLASKTKLFVHVGQSPTSETGGWNGGGNGRNSSVGGGGATDISLYGSEGSSDWNNSNHLYSRIIVAGGGGGSACNSRLDLYGGCGGGTRGQSPGTASNNEGTQTGAGISSSQFSSGQGFGVGGSVVTHCSSGGGSGWYGGSTIDINDGHYAGGAGGSGYVYSSSTASNYPSGCRLNSSFYLTAASTHAGNTSFPSPSNSGNETGHSGNGFARITAV